MTTVDVEAYSNMPCGGYLFLSCCWAGKNSGRLTPARGRCKIIAGQYTCPPNLLVLWIKKNENNNTTPHSTENYPNEYK